MKVTVPWLLVSIVFAVADAAVLARHPEEHLLLPSIIGGVQGAIFGHFTKERHWGRLSSLSQLMIIFGTGPFAAIFATSREPSWGAAAFFTQGAIAFGVRALSRSEASSRESVGDPRGLG